MIRAVLDTNILVSAFFWVGPPRTVLNAARSGEFRLLSSEPLIAELKTVLYRSKFSDRLFMMRETADSLIDNGYRALVEIVEPANIESVVLKDRDDDALIACAVGGRANYLVSGDHHLLELKSYLDIQIITVNSFLEETLLHKP